MNEQNTTRSKKDLILTIVCLALCAIFAFILVCNVIIIIKDAVDPDNPPRIFGLTPLVVVSDSMHGTRPGHIERNDLIFVEYVPFDQLHVGDVVSFKDRGSLTTHRLKEYRPFFEYKDEETGENRYGGWVTGGDYLGTDDPHILVEDTYIGRVAGRVPAIGGLFLLLKNPFVMVLCIGIPLGLIILIDLLNKKKAEKAAKEAKADKTTELEDKAAALEAELARLRALAGEAAAPSVETVDSETTKAESDTASE